MNFRKFAIAAGIVAAAGAAALACSGDDDDNTTPVTTDAGSDAAPGVQFTHSTLLKFVQNVVNNQIAKTGVDPLVLSYFVPNIPDDAGQVPGSHGGVTLAAIEDCLAAQIGADPNVNDGDHYSAANPWIAKGLGVGGADYTCRADMSAIHASLDIPGPVFAKFLNDILTEATVEGFANDIPAGLTADLQGLSTSIVDPNAPDACSETAPASCAYGWQNATTGDDASSGDDAASGDDSSTPTDAGTDSAIADSASDAPG